MSRVLGYAANPAFTPGVARLLVGSLSPAQLASLWRATSALLPGSLPGSLAGSLSVSTRMGLVLLRAECLDRMETEDPERFDALLDAFA